jgi:ABC-type sugar transport system substrate-binding protein
MNRVPHGHAPRPARLRRRPIRAIAVAVIAAGGLLLAACGSGSSTSSASSSSSSSTSGLKSAYTGPSISTSALASMIFKATYDHASPSSLPANLVETLRVAGAEQLTSAQQALVASCVKNMGCNTGGTGNLTVAILDPGPNVYLTLFEAEGVAQALAYKQVKSVKILDANYDLGTFLTDFRSFIAQKPSILIVNNSYGASALPLFRQATAAGILTFAVAQGVPGGTPGKDFTSVVYNDECALWTGAAEAAVSATTSGSKVAALLTGPPGGTYSSESWPCIKKVLAANGWTVGYTGYTSYTPQGEITAANAMLSSGKNISAVFYESGPDNIIKTYLSAGKTPPNFYSAGGVTQSTYALWKQEQGTAHQFNVDVASLQPWEYRVAVTAGVDKIVAGTPIQAQDIFPRVTLPIQQTLSFADTSVPASTAMTSLLPATALNSLFG